MRPRLRDILAVVLGALIALGAVFLVEGNALYNFKFNTGRLDLDAMRSEVEDVLKKFNKGCVDLYTSGGDFSFLGDLPADNILKRRLVQDINAWSSGGVILSHDRHAFDITSVEIINPSLATVETLENWVLLLRSRATGKRMKGQKQNLVRLRYILRKVEGAWKVMDFEVYAPDDELPPLDDIWVSMR